MAGWERGFTLGELLIVLAIFGTLTAISLPHWVALLPSYRLNGATRQVQSELLRIKRQAASENRGFRMVFSTAKEQYELQRNHGTNAAPNYQTTGEIKPLPEGICVLEGVTISLTSRGTASPGTVKLCSSNGSGANVIVSGTGRVRIVKVNVCGGTC